MAKNRHIAQRQDERDLQPPTLTVDEAIAVFDKSAKRTTPNVQTAAWDVLRAEIMRLREYEIAAGMLSIEKAEWRRRAESAERNAALALPAQGEGNNG